MANIIDQIIQGVIDPAQNEALLNITKIFGSQMMGGADGPSMLVKLSAALNPVYIGLLFMILAYIGIGGVVRTAMDGKFLGRQWSSVGVPASFMVCILLLSPIPTQSGATLGQVIFVKGIKFGSNFADFTLMKTFEVSAATDYANSNSKYNLVGEHIPQVNEQMKNALTMYICAEQLKQMGYGTKVNYFVILNQVCGLPADMVGQPEYESYYTLGSAASIATMSKNNAAWTQMTGITLPEPVKYATTNVTGYVSNQTPITKQLVCHFEQFRNYFQKDVDPAIATASKIAVTPGIGKVTALSGNGIPEQLNNRVLTIEEKALGAMWGKALHESYKCLMSKAFQNKLETAYETKGDTAVPWRAGWSNAALSITDELGSYRSKMQEGNLPLNMEVIKTPNPNLLGDSLMDKRNAAILQKMMRTLEQFTTNVNSQPNAASQILASNLSGGANVGNTLATSSAVDYGRIAANVLLPTAANGASQFVTNNINGTDPIKAEKAKRTLAFMNNVIGKSTTVGSMGLGKITRAATTFFSWATSMLGKKEVIDKKADLAATAAPAGLGLVVVALKGAADMLAPGPTTMMVLTVLLVLLNVIMLLPQVVMLVVMLIWMVKAAVWYMIIPLATVLIALPGTRVGHDIWKSALSIILMPLLALIFYLVSIMIFDQMYMTIIYWIFEPIIRQFQDGAGWGVWEVFKQIITGEIIFRLMAGAVLFITVTVYMSMMILKGPDLVTQSLGLRGSSGDLGDEFSALRGKLDPSGRMFGR